MIEPIGTDRQGSLQVEQVFAVGGFYLATGYACPTGQAAIGVLAAEQYGSSRWVIRRTSDGVRWSQESVAELLGVDDADITSVQCVHTAGEQVVVAVNTKPSTVDGVPRQLVLVGTPRG
jgi:hypothetical protein